MAIYLLTARQVQAASDGDHADGGGLVLKVHASRARWLFRFTSPAGVRRAMGVGAAHRDTLTAAGRSLTTAREAADKARNLLQGAVDPIDAKASERERARKVLEQKRPAAKQERTTLARVARAYHERVIEASRSTKHAAQWIACRQAFDELGGVPQLVEWAKENRTDFYKLSARLIPTEIEATGDGLGPLVVKIVHYGPSEKSSNTDGLHRGG